MNIDNLKTHFYLNTEFTHFNNSGQALNQIKENTSEVLNKLDDIIWATNPKNDKVINLVERMDNFARPLCIAN